MFGRFLFYVLVITMAAFPAVAEGSEDVDWPDAPAAMRFASLLDALLSGIDEEFVRENFSPEFLSAFSIKQHLGSLKNVTTMHGAFHVHKIEKSSDHEIVLLARGKKSEAWRRFVLQTEPEPPYRVAGLGIDMAQPPQSSPATTFESFDGLSRHLKERAADNRFSGVELVAKEGKPVFEGAHGFASKRQVLR
jgi:hypothetical protein